MSKYNFGSIWNRVNRLLLRRMGDSVEEIEKSIQDLVAEGQLTPAEYALLVTIVNSNIKKGEVSVDDIDLNRGKLTESHLSEQLLKQITGGAPVSTIPADGSVTTPKLYNNSVTRIKKTPFGETATITGSAPAEVDFQNNEIRYSHEDATNYVMHRGLSYTIPSETIIRLTPNNGISGLWFNIQTRQIKEIRYTGRYDDIQEDDVLLGFLYLNRMNTLNADLYGNYSFVGDDTKPNSSAYVISNEKVDFDFENSRMVFPRNSHAYVFLNGRRYQINSLTTVDFTEYKNDAMFKIMFSAKYLGIYFARHNESTNNLDANLGAVINSTQTVLFNGDFTVNGQDYILPGLGEVKYLGSDAVDINVDDRVVTFPSPTALLYINGVEYRIQNDRKIINLHAVSNLQKLVFNTATEDFRISTSNTMFNSDFVVMAIKLTDPVQVDFSGSYSINGSPPDASSILDYNLEDMIWSWWIYPLATRFKGMRDRTYIGYTDSKGYSGVGSYDNDTGNRVKIKLKTDRIDDHNAAAVDVMEDGRIIAAYSTGHNTDGNIHIRVSSNVESVEEFDAPTTVRTNGRITYAHLFNGGGKWYLFFRGPEGDECSYTSSVDGKTWSDVTTLLDYEHVCYPKIQYTTDPNILRFVITTNPMSGERHFRLGFFDMATSQFKKEDGTVLGTERVTREEIPLILERESRKSQRLLDVAVTDLDETIIGYSTFTAQENAEDADYRIAVWKDDELHFDVLTNAGMPFWGGSNYVGGIAFGYEANEVYLSREDNDIWHIEKWTTDDQRTWEKSETLHSTKEGYVALRPILEKNGDKILWHEGVYNSDFYNDFYTDVKFLKIRDL